MNILEKLAIQRWRMRCLNLCIRPDGIGEVVKLNRDDINFQMNSVIVHGKGDKEREVYFNTRCSIWLKRYFDERDDEEPCLFITSFGRKGV